jgi:hypothetical protein
MHRERSEARAPYGCPSVQVCSCPMRPWAARFRFHRVPFLAIAVSLASAGPVYAVPPTAHPGASSGVSSTAHQGAMRAYADARALYQQGRYRDAVKRLEEARVLDPAAKELPYNLALVHEKLGELDDAVRYMTMYAAMETDPVEKERAEKAVERLEGARKDLAAHEETPAAPPPPPADTAPPPVVTAAPPPPAPPPRGRLDKWTIGTAGLSVVALGAGTFFGVSALRQSPNDPTTSPSGTTVAELRDDASSAHRKATMADIGFGVAIAAGAAAVILYFTRRETRPGAAAHAAPPARGLEVRF